MHDPRLGRFFAIDPLTAKYPFYSPYAFSGNRVVDCKELEGLEPDPAGKPIGTIELAAEDGTKNVYYWTLKQCEVSSNCVVFEKGDPYTHPSVKENAELANAVYNIFNEKLDININDRVGDTEYTLYKKYGGDPGYKAALYRREIDGVEFFVLSFAGTDDMHDAAEDAFAALASDLEHQIIFGLKDAERINDWCAARGANFSTTGHSLGGGIAAAAGLTAQYACTFNARGISSTIEEKYGFEISNAKKIDAYIIKGEILDATQPYKANGTRHEVKPESHSYGNDPTNLLYNIAVDRAYLHSISRFLEIYRK